MSLSVAVYACINTTDKVDLTSNWCVTTPVNVKIHSTCPKFFGHRSEVSPALPKKRSSETRKPYFGAHGEEETPVLIPNTEVKLLSGDYTAKSGKLARCRII